MHYELFDLAEKNGKKIGGLDVQLSFNRFLNYLEQRIAATESVKKGFFEYVLNKFLSNKHLKDVIPVEEIKYFREELELMYNLLQPPLADESLNLWGICIPIDPVIFFGTEAFYNLIRKSADFAEHCDERAMPTAEMIQQRLQFIYSIIFSKVYNQPFSSNLELTHSVNFEEEGLAKYFRINIDTRFVDVQVKGEIPDFKMAVWSNEIRNEDFDWKKGLAELPLDLFAFRGFGIITVEDVTEEQSVENIKSLTLNRNGHTDSGYNDQVIESLKSLLGSSKIEFGLLPNLRINDHLVFSGEERATTVMWDVKNRKDQEQTLLTFAESYLNHPKTVIFGENEFSGKYKVIEDYLEKAGIQSYALLPVYHSNKVAGALEVYSMEKDQLTHNRLVKLRPVLPIIAQLLQNTVDEFNTSIDSVIMDKFTALQPAVQWKFKEVAWHYLRDHQHTARKPIIEKIRFTHVYPLYGAIDIRNSTIERNKALVLDLNYQLELVLDLLTKAKNKVGILLIDEMIFKCKKWLNAIDSHFNDYDAVLLSEFLDQEAEPLLKHVAVSHPELKEAVDYYFATINEANGAAFQHRRALENSMKAINTVISQQLEDFNTELQKLYPAYFEKFRTDGLEYDIYIGQSIAPHLPFNPLYLKNIRLWQLRTMAEIARLTGALCPAMEHELETTQLIFIRSVPIDIAFRPDERKFDVEGSYNIRYQIVKKRIDKVHLKNSTERLTQPGKIALVYFNRNEADEYKGYISYLQNEGLLKEDLEFLELEDLQGVSGLRAMRVGIAAAAG
ncbi:MAG TPA: GAF domain-containing protein [Niabella sp.]